jgi:hypothetical protein
MAGFALQHVACPRVLILRGRSSEPAPGTTGVAGVVGAAGSPLFVLDQTEWYAVAFIVAEMSPSKPSSCRCLWRDFEEVIRESVFGGLVEVACCTALVISWLRDSLARF